MTTTTAPITPKDTLIEKLRPVQDVLASQDFAFPHLVRRALEEKFPADSAWFSEVKGLVRQGVVDGWLCDRENAGVKFSRLQKAPGEKGSETGFSMDAVHMNRSPGSPHTHPNGEVSIAFAVDGAPKFDGNLEGWTVYGPRSWHVPIVSGGVMDIVYFLPKGAMVFGDRPGTPKPTSAP